MGPVVGSLVPQNWPLNNTVEDCSIFTGRKSEQFQEDSAHFWNDSYCLAGILVLFWEYKLTHLVSHSSLGIIKLLC